MMRATVLVFVLGSLLVACGGSNQCGKDTDCKGDRVCVQGACVDRDRGSVSSDGVSHNSDSYTPPTGDGPKQPPGGGIRCTRNIDGIGCSCGQSQAGYPANSEACNASMLPRPGSCCADPGWPSAGGCQCKTVYCNPTGDTCSCMLFSTSTGQTSCSGALCCAIIADLAGSCGCFAKPGTAGCSIFKNATQVSSCTAETTPCDAGEKKVASCR